MPVVRAPVLLLLCRTLLAADPNSWPQFRGPDGQGHARPPWACRRRGASTRTSSGSARCPAAAGRAPCMAGHEIWLTTAVESPVTEAEKGRADERDDQQQPLDQCRAGSACGRCA